MNTKTIREVAQTRRPLLKASRPGGFIIRLVYSTLTGGQGVTRIRVQLTFMREIYLHSCKGIYTAPLLARALVHGVEKHLVINMYDVAVTKHMFVR